MLNLQGYSEQTQDEPVSQDITGPSINNQELITGMSPSRSSKLVA